MAFGRGTNGSSTISLEDESISVTSSYTTLVTLDLDESADAVIILHNSSGDETMDYKIFASSKEVSTIPADGHDSWVNILDLSTDPVDYDVTTSRTLAAGQTFYESLSNKFRWFRIEMKAQTTSLTAKAWIRGRTTT